MYVPSDDGSPRYQPLQGKWYEQVFQVVVAGVVSVLIFNAPAVFAWTADIVAQNVSVIVGQVSAVIVTLLLGLLLYNFRCRIPGWYGICECMFGLVTAVTIANQLLREDEPSMQNLILFFSWCAALYVIVRGLDTYGRSLEGTPRYASWQKMFYGKAPKPKNS